MVENKKGAYVNDLDILDWIGWDDNENEVVDDGTDILAWIGGEPTSEEPITPPVEELVVDETKPVEPTEEPTKEDKTKEGEDNDIDEFIKQLLEENKDVVDKVDEIKESIPGDSSPETKKLLDDLLSLVAEKDMSIKELQKQVEVSNGRYLDKFGEDNELSLYKWEIDKLNDNPKLMVFVKHYGTSNEKIKNKLISIASDFLYDLTGQDVSELLYNKDKDAASILNWAGSDSSPMPELAPEKEDKPLTFEESTNDLF